MDDNWREYDIIYNSKTIHVREGGITGLGERIDQTKADFARLKSESEQLMDKWADNFAREISGDALESQEPIADDDDE